MESGLCLSLPELSLFLYHTVMQCYRLYLQTSAGVEQLWWTMNKWALNLVHNFVCLAWCLLCFMWFLAIFLVHLICSVGTCFLVGDLYACVRTDFVCILSANFDFWPVESLNSQIFCERYVESPVLQLVFGPFYANVRVFFWLILCFCWLHDLA